MVFVGMFLRGIRICSYFVSIFFLKIVVGFFGVYVVGRGRESFVVKGKL